MWALIIEVVALSIVVLMPGCSGGTCKNPKRILAPDPVNNAMREGPAIRCHGVLVCPMNGGRPDSRSELTELEDPKFVDRGSKKWNEDGCRQAILKMFDTKCTVEVSPETICLDVGGAAGGPGPDFTGPTGGGLVTVGVGSGDFQLNENGAGGIGGFSADPGDGGQGGI